KRIGQLAAGAFGGLLVSSIGVHIGLVLAGQVIEMIGQGVAHLAFSLSRRRRTAFSRRLRSASRRAIPALGLLLRLFIGDSHSARSCLRIAFPASRRRM